VSPGYRVDAFVPMPTTPQTLCLVGVRPQTDNGDASGPSNLPASLIAIINVSASAPAATTMVMPAESDVTALAPPTSWTGTVDGVSTTVSCDTVTHIDQRIGLLMEPSAMASPGDSSDGGACTPPAQEYNKNPNAAVCLCPVPNISCQNFNDRRAWGYRSDRVGTVNTSERWEIVAFDGHPFHMHINPFLVCPNNSDKEPNFAHWRDTFWVQVDDGPRDLMMDFRKFTGQFVLHCHKLNHEDQGMMELVELCDAGDTSCLTGPDCQAADPQCTFAAQTTAAWPQPPAPNPPLCGP
jgi:FtsP/CotA-like multicopper oxidase with cupredoxin domain